MSDRSILYCPHCQTGLRLPTGKSGFVICPNCENRVKADTTALGLALQEAWWVPKWYWIIIVFIAFYGYIYWYVPKYLPIGYNPLKTISAGFWGAICGAIGGLLGAIIEQLRKRESNLFILIFSVLGFYVGTLASTGLETITKDFISAELTFLAVAGAVTSSLVGFILHLGLLRRNPKFGSIAFWVCVFIGSFGGLVLSVPMAIGLYFYGRYRFKLIEN